MYNYYDTDEYDFETQIEIDRKNYLAEDTVFLNEALFNKNDVKHGLKKGYKFIKDAKDNKLDLNVKKLDVNKTIDTAVDLGAKALNNTKKVSKNMIKDSKVLLTKLKHSDNALLIDGNSNGLNKLIKMISMSENVAAFCCGPIIGIINLGVKKLLRNSNVKDTLKRRYKLKKEFEVQLAVIDERLADLRQSNLEKDRKYKYELIKLKKTLENNIEMLDHNNKVDRHKLGLDNPYQRNYMEFPDSKKSHY